jgi:hypothetical protein
LISSCSLANPHSAQSTAFAEFFTPWLVPYEHFIPVRPDLADLPAKIEWARANDGEVHLGLFFFHSRFVFRRMCSLYFLLFVLRLPSIIRPRARQLGSHTTQHNTTQHTHRPTASKNLGAPSPSASSPMRITTATGSPCCLGFGARGSVVCSQTLFDGFFFVAWVR